MEVGISVIVSWLQGRQVKVGRSAERDPWVVNIWLPCGLLSLDPVYSLPPPVCFLQCT